MVSNEEIKRMLENRRRGIKTEPKKEAPTPVPPASTRRKPMGPATKTCESCGAQTPKDAKFCIKCGHTLKEPENAMDKAAVEAPEDVLPRSGLDGIDYRTCPNCSHQNKAQAKFCVVCGHKLEDTPLESSETGSLLDQVPDTPTEPEVEEEALPESEELGEENPTPAMAELAEEKPVPEETAPQSSLSRKTPEEEPRAEEVMVEEESLEEVPAEETAQEEVLEEASEVIPAEETEDLPQVKTFKFGQDSLEVEESEAPVVAEEVDEDASQASDGSDPVEKIKKAKELLDIGAITPEEFEEIKKKYLAMI